MNQSAEHLIEFNNETIERIAVEIHNQYLRYLSRDTNYKEVQQALKYDVLSEEDRETNRSFARNIPKMLSSLGYSIESRAKDSLYPEFKKQEITLLAIKEHNRWKEQKIKMGWRFGKKKDYSLKLHPCLVDWNELPSIEKNKDMFLIQTIPIILKKTGFTLFKCLGQS